MCVYGCVSVIASTVSVIKDHISRVTHVAQFRNPHPPPITYVGQREIRKQSREISHKGAATQDQVTETSHARTSHTGPSDRN